MSIVQQNVEVQIPHLRRTLKASYGYQNGRYNLIQPEQFGLSDEEQAIDKASRVAIAGKFLYEGDDEKLGLLQLVVVGLASKQSGTHGRGGTVTETIRHGRDPNGSF